MSRQLVSVEHTWQGSTVFEFDTAEEAQAFADKVNAGDLGAIVDAGDIDTSGVGLTNFSAGKVKEEQ